MKYRTKKTCAVILAAALTLAAGITAYAGPSGTAEEGQMSEEQKALLADNVIAFSEIANRIELYNQTYRNTAQTIYSSVGNNTAARIMAEDAKDMMEDARDFKDEDRLLYEEYKAAAIELRKLAQKTSGKKLSETYKRSLRQVKDNLTKSVEGVLIQYHQTLAKKNMVDKARELAAQGLVSTQDSYRFGLTGTAGVLSAQKSDLSAENSALQLNSGLQTLRQTIQVLLGYSADEDVTFEALPEPDIARIETIDLAADTETAIASNYTLLDTRKTAAKGTRARLVKSRTVENSRQEISSAMEELYQNILAKKQAYDAAQTAFAAASDTMASADRKNALGMLSKAQYLQAQMAYAQAEAERISASGDLLKALNDYDWGRAGLITIS